ncbi:MAG: 3'(2'),5'-bisphosphate nucleotidase CysQ [Acidobacteriota bacterium]
MTTADAFRVAPSPPISPDAADDTASLYHPATYATATAVDAAAWLDDIVALARGAGRAILAVYHGDDDALDVRRKDDDSPVTAADDASHRHIADRLARRAVRLPIVSEESAAPAWSTRARWQRYWLIDPLDGTKEFLKRNDEFSVNIALIEDGVPRLGVVHAPVLGETYAAVRGAGAWQIDADGGRTPLDAAGTADAAPLRIISSRSHGSPRLAAFRDALDAPHEVTRLGSALKMGRVAAGVADVYPRLGPTMTWDTAAAHAVLDEAGGALLTVDGDALRYDRPSLRNPWFVALSQRGARSAWRQALDAANRAR